MSRTTDSQWHLGESRPWPPPTPPPARRHRDTTAHPRPASLQSPGVTLTYTTSSLSKGTNPQGKGPKEKAKSQVSPVRAIRLPRSVFASAIPTPASASDRRSGPTKPSKSVTCGNVCTRSSSRSGQNQLSLRIAASTPTKKPTKVHAVPANRRLSAPCIAHPRTNRPRAFEGKALVSKPLSSIPTNGVSPANVLSRYTLKGLSLCNFGYGRG